jgi:methyltransferase (TIGR00027 family)
MEEGLIENVSDTAFWVAYYREVETRRSDALFRDPLAGVLAGDRGKKIAQKMPLPAMTAWVIAIRTRIIDEYIGRAIGEGIDTVINLGAGLDTRPYRMDVPSELLWIEADYSHMIEFKQTRLAKEKPRCRLERVKIDLANPIERRRLFAEVDARAKRLLILTEGVVPYLSVEEAGSLADDLKMLPHACYWVVDYLSPEALKFRKNCGMARMTRKAPFKFAPGDWFGFFREHGWRLKELRYFGEEAERLRRPLRLPVLMMAISAMGALFASRQRRRAHRKLAGYAVLEPEGAAHIS